MENLDNDIELLRNLKLEIHSLRKCFDDISDEMVLDNLKKIIIISEKIYKEVAVDTLKLNKVRNYIRFYLPTVIKVLERYIKFKDSKINNKEMISLYTKIEEFFPKAYESFKKIYDSLFTSEILDIDSEIKIMLKEMGL